MISTTKVKVGILLKLVSHLISNQEKILMKQIRLKKMKSEISLFKDAFESQNDELCRHHLGRAHILSQCSVIDHLNIHLLMLVYSLRQFNFNECMGQLLRLFVTCPGHLFGRVPQGNIGWSSVALTEELPIPEDLKEYC
jgi:hypothetical protein